MNFRKLFTVALLTVPLLAVAGAPPNPMARLEAGLGTATGTFTLKTGDQVHKLTGTRTCNKASGGAAIQCTLSVSGVPGMASYEETGLFGYDAVTRAVHYYTVTNAGEVHDHKGGFTGNVLKLEHSGKTADGKTMVERISIDFTRAGEETLRTVQLIDGTEALVLEGKWVRRRS